MHPHRYRIFIGGGPNTAICEAFEGFTIASDGLALGGPPGARRATLRRALINTTHTLRGP